MQQQERYQKYHLDHYAYRVSQDLEYEDLHHNDEKSSRSHKYRNLLLNLITHQVAARLFHHIVSKPRNMIISDKAFYIEMLYLLLF